MISTPRRRATINPFPRTTPVCPNRSLSILYPYTPPSTPASCESLVDLGIESVAVRKYDEAFERIEAKSKWIQTLPSSNYSSTGTIRRVPPKTSTPVKADEPRLGAPVQPQLSEPTSWIIMELEAWVASIHLLSLQLDSPVILQICLAAGQRRVPIQASPTLPLNRYSSINGPLSSHPTHSSFKAPLRAATPQTCRVPRTNSSLHNIFPQATSQLLSSLQATYLALHFVSTISLPSPSSTSSSMSYGETHSPLSRSMSYIPAKARAMLGLQTPTTRPGLPACWTLAETRGWRERIGNLQCKLRGEAARLTTMCEGSGLGDKEALVRAVGQVVIFGQDGASR